jgi:hypothetical protein
MIKHNKIRILGFMLLLIVSLQLAYANCTVNGEEVPCDQFWSMFGWMFIVMFIILIAGLAFWLWMLVDCLTRDFKDKLVWVFVIVLLSVLGAIIYLFAVKIRSNQKDMPPQKSQTSGN